jgi:hypothetical protein
MPASRGVAIAALALLINGSALAKSSLQGQLTLSGGWTDNILSTPYTSNGGIPLTVRPESGWFGEVRPSLIFTTGDPRAVQRLAYTFDALLYAEHTEADSWSHRLEWQGFFLPSRTSEMILTAVANQGRLNGLLLSQVAMPGVAAPLTIPSTSTDFYSVFLGEAANTDVTAHWRVTQTLSFNTYQPYEGSAVTAPTYDLNLGLGADYSFRRDAFGFNVVADYIHFDSTGPTSPSREQSTLPVTLRWRHDFGHWWALDLSVGETTAVVHSFDTTSNTWVTNHDTQPTGALALRCTYRYAGCEFNYSHTVQINVLAGGGVFSVDNFGLRGGVPFGEASHVALSLGFNYAHARQIALDTGGVVSNLDTITADATLFWTPRAEVSIFARYQLVDQYGHAEDFLPLPSVMRNTVTVGITGLYPGEAAVVVPTQSALRVDRADFEGIPEPHSQPVEPQR